MRSVLRALLGLILLASPTSAWTATALVAVQPSDSVGQQKRLTDADCNAGDISRQPSAATGSATKPCPDQDLALRIESGMHMAPIGNIGVDAACSQLVTGSDDKTVRLWSLPEGRLIRTIRLPIGAGNVGKIYAVALSPDGHTVAAGGWDAAWDKDKSGGHGLYLVDLLSSKVRRVGAFEGVVGRIAFSADGERIALSIRGNWGVRVIDRDTGQVRMADQSYGGEVYGLAFGSDGALFTTSMDGFLRRYGPDGKLVIRTDALDGAQPYGVAPSPDGSRLAVGYYDAKAVSIIDTKTLKVIVRGNTEDVTAGDNLSQVAWTARGDLIAGGNATETIDGSSSVFLRRFGAHRQDGDRAVAGTRIVSLMRCGAGVAYAAEDRFGLMTADRTVHQLAEPITVNMRHKVEHAFAISTNATQIRFGLRDGENNPVLFDVTTGTLSDAPDRPYALDPPDTYHLLVTDWEGSWAPRLGSTLLPLNQNELSRSLAIQFNKTGFVLGTNFAIRSFDSGGSIRWTKPTPETAYGVNIARDGRLVVAAYGDGTIRWHRWSDGQELLALFVDAKDRRWVAWTPTGYYMASPGGEDLIGWHLNRGWNQEADFFPASRFRDKFNRPDVVQTVLKTLDEGEALRQADEVAHKRPNDTKPLIEHLPPVVTILSPADGAGVMPGMAEVRYRVRLPSGGTVERVEAFVDGAKVEARGLAPATQPAGADGEGSINLPMPAHDAAISLVAYAGGKASDAARVVLKSAVPAAAAATDEALKPSLYALLIGVTHYDVERYDLVYPAQDATGLAAALKSQEGRLYRHVEVKVLTDKDATATGIKRGLSWLGKQTTARDLAIVFAAGHGTTDAKGKFWFLSSDMDPEDIGATAVSQDDIENVLFDLPGKKLLFLDACHSGAALNAGARGATDVSAAVSDFAQAEGGVVAYAASTGREFSFERDDWGHGAFTKALIEGLGGGADLLHQGTITTATLDLFVEDRVKQLTGGQQHPVMTRPKTVPDFPIALVER